MIGIKIKSIRPLADEPLECVALELRSGEKCERKRFILPLGFCAERGVGVGACSQSSFDELERQASLSAALRKGQLILSYGANSRSALVKKLERRGISCENAESAAAELCARGYIDDEKSVSYEVASCLRKLWGPRRILSHLRQKGYRDSALDAAQNELAAVDFSENCRRLIEKRYPDARDADRTKRRRAYAALMRYGYSQSDIRDALSGKERKL